MLPLLGLFLLTPLAEAAVLSADGSPGAPAVALATAPATSDSTPFGAPTAFMIGSLHLEQGEPALALPFLEHAYRLAPGARDFADAYVAALAMLNRRDEALAVLRDQASSTPADPVLQRHLAALLTDMQRFDEALSAVAEARRVGGEDPELLLLEGEIMARAGRADQAIERYRAALERLPDRGEQISLILAALYRETGRSADLLALWPRALSTWPTSRRLRLSALRDLVARGRVEEALAVAARGDSLPSAASFDTTEADFSWTVEAASLLVQAGRVDEAVRVLEARRRANRLDREGTLWLGRLLMNRGRGDDALALLRDAVRRWPDSARARLHLGETLLARGEAVDGEVQLRRARSLDPSDPDPLVALIRLLTMRVVGMPGSSSAADTAPRAELVRLATQAGELVRDDQGRRRLIVGAAFRVLKDPARAAEHFEAAARDTNCRPEALLELAGCQEDLRRDDEARVTLEALRREHPDDPVAANALGYFLAEHGRELARADSLVREALAKQPDNPYFLDSLGWIAHQRGDHRAAFDLLVKASNAAPDQVEILEHLGLTLQALGRPIEAARVLRRALVAGGDAERIGALLRKLEAAGGAR